MSISPPNSLEYGIEFYYINLFFILITIFKIILVGFNKIYKLSVFY